MLYRPLDTQKKASTNQKSINYAQYHHQHGERFSILLAFPSESLTHITCFLDPRSLLALERTNKHLNRHVEDDNIWHRAFVCQLLDIPPEGDLHNAKTLMLRRCEVSWKKEFIARYHLRRYVAEYEVYFLMLTRGLDAGKHPATPQSLIYLIILRLPLCT